MTLDSSLLIEWHLYLFSLPISRVNPRADALTYSMQSHCLHFQLGLDRGPVGEPRAAPYSRSVVPTVPEAQTSSRLAGKGARFFFWLSISDQLRDIQQNSRTFWNPDVPFIQ